MKVLLIDDHPLIREAMARHLGKLSDQLEVWEANDCEEGFRALAENGPADLVLIDLMLPRMSGLEGMRVIHADHPDTPIVALSSSDDPATMEAVYDAGALAFLPKSSKVAEILDALQRVLVKCFYMPATINRGATPSSEAAGAAAPAAPYRDPATLTLTPRQVDVLFQILKGSNIKQIARDMDLSTGTVKSHTSAVLRVLGVTTRMEAVAAASRLRLRFDDAAQRSTASH